MDLPAFHAALRDWEDGEVGAIHPVTHTWKALALGGGAFMYGLDFINGWQLRFPTPGNYTVQGNLNATILPVAGVFVLSFPLTALIVKRILYGLRLKKSAV